MTLLDNFFLEEEANRLKESGFITLEQSQVVIDQLPMLKSQKNIFIRIGFFILGIFMYSSICGTVSLFGLQLGQESSFVLFYLFALIGFGVKEFMATKMNFFGYGLDDAFILGAISTLLFAIGFTMSQHNFKVNFLLLFIIMAIVSSGSYLRYLNLSLAFMACIGITGSLIFFMFELGSIGKSILPFVLIQFSAMSYFLSVNTFKNLKVPYYSKGIQLATTFSLLLFYLSGNYFVVRELSILLLEKEIPATEDIPFSFFFYAFSFIVPVGYLFFSLLKKDKTMLWIGFLSLCCSIFTIRYYYHILPDEIVLTIGGIILFVDVYFSIKRIKHNESGITFLPDRFSDSNSLLNAEIILATSQFGLKPEIKPEESPMDFGGGGFSGGGSNGEF